MTNTLFYMKSLFIMFALLCGCILAKAETRIVSNTNNSGLGSLRAEIDSAQSGDTIRFSPSLIASGTDSIVLTTSISTSKSLTIIGLYNSSDSLILSGGNTSRLFYVFSASHFTLDSLIIQNGFSTSANGGAIYYNIEGNIIIKNCIFRNNRISNNSSSSGGAIWAFTDSSVVLKNCLLTNNSAKLVRGGSGGGAFFQAENVSIEDCTISENNITSLYNSYGAGIAIYFKDELIVANNNISNNSAISNSYNKSHGGGIFAVSAGFSSYPNNSSIISNNTINHNSTLSSYSTSSGAYGGGIYVISDSIVINKNTVNGNSISTSGDALSPSGFAYGGGIYAKSTNLIIISDNEIDSNTVTSTSYKSPRGGGIYAEADSSVIVRNSLISRNKVSTTRVVVAAGGVFAKATYGSVIVDNCKIDSNKVLSSYNVWNRSSFAGGLELFFAKNSTINNNSTFIQNPKIASGVYIFKIKIKEKYYIKKCQL